MKVLQGTRTVLQQSNETLEKQFRKSRDSFSAADLERKSLHSELETLRVSQYFNTVQV